MAGATHPAAAPGLHSGRWFADTAVPCSETHGAKRAIRALDGQPDLRHCWRPKCFEHLKVVTQRGFLDLLSWAYKLAEKGLVFSFYGHFLTEGSSTNFFLLMCCISWRIPGILGGHYIEFYCDSAHCDVSSSAAFFVTFRCADSPRLTRRNFWTIFAAECS